MCCPFGSQDDSFQTGKAQVENYLALRLSNQQPPVLVRFKSFWQHASRPSKLALLRTLSLAGSFQLQAMLQRPFDVTPRPSKPKKKKEKEK